MTNVIPSSNTQSTTPSSSSTSPKSTISSTIPIRIAKSTNRALRALVVKCNKKSLGRKAKADDVIKCALSLIKEADIEKM